MVKNVSSFNGFYEPVNEHTRPNTGLKIRNLLVKLIPKYEHYGIKINYLILQKYETCICPVNEQPFIHFHFFDFKRFVFPMLGHQIIYVKEARMAMQLISDIYLNYLLFKKINNITCILKLWLQCDIKNVVCTPSP
ncbi:hypothetical protein PYW08_011636 [Mythimna loreyi]|uniref:Uncharacterized protein n=1 Tax=Mythimna loreyi TaxID=667449 RepID=A0ACC2QK32_9NEOP|nr:hypothetical protein PYW08_011636 [Mythimna loreyi]